MFERYTEKARRVIFFARYEASQFGCSCIETEHLVLGVLREGKALANQFLASEAVRHSITQRRKPDLKVSTSVDLPLSHESKRALAYAAEESERMNHKHIGTVHLLLGLLREEKSFGAQLLREQGLTLDLVREQAQQSEVPLAQGQSASIAGFDHWLAEREASGSMWTVKCQRVANGTTHFAIYASDPPKENEKSEDVAPAQKLAQIQMRIDFIIQGMENAIANHEFEKARFYSDEERKERENLRLLRSSSIWKNHSRGSRSCVSRSSATTVSPKFKNAAMITSPKASPRYGFCTLVLSAPTPSPKPMGSASSRAKSSKSQTRRWKWI